MREHLTAKSSDLGPVSGKADHLIQVIGVEHVIVVDENQEVARAFGAVKTPDVFLFDGDLRLRYRGAPDSDYEDESQNAAWLREALDALLDGSEPDRAETEPVGCTIKWK